MSHVATNWAFQQRGLTPIAFRLLANLADCHNPSSGCFPSQAFLADRCEVSRASVNRHLDELERLGLIRREARINPDTKRQERTRYRLAFEPDFQPLDIVSRVSTTDTESGPGRVQTGDTDDEASRVSGGDTEDADSRVSQIDPAVSHSSETLTCKEPVTPLPPDDAPAPMTEPALDFEALVHRWPAQKHGNLARADAAFRALGVEDRKAALRAAEPTLIGLVRLKRGLPKLVGYLEQRLFAEFVDAPEIDSEGRFIITPTRPEWKPWVGAVRAQFGQRGVDSIVKWGRYLTHTRWPEGHPNAARRAAHGHG